MAGKETTGLLVECRDEPGVLYRITEAIFRHGANITYVAGGAARSEALAELQLEVSGIPEQAQLIADLEEVRGDKGQQGADVSSDLWQARDRDRRRRPGWHGGPGRDLRSRPPQHPRRADLSRHHSAGRRGTARRRGPCGRAITPGPCACACRCADGR